MICKTCNLKGICKTYDFIKNIDHADVTINNCNFDLNLHLPDRLTQFNNNKRNVDIVPYQGQAKPNLKDLEKLIKNIPEKPEPIKIECPTCKGITYDDDIKICSKCGKKICSNCGTSADGELFCKECWEKE